MGGVCVIYVCHVCVCMCLSLCAPVVCSAPGDQKRASDPDPLELETQSDAWYGCWEPNTSSERGARSFNYSAIFPVPSARSLIQPMSLCLGMVPPTVD